MSSDELYRLFQELQTSDEHHSASLFQGEVFWEACKTLSIELSRRK